MKVQFIAYQQLQYLKLGIVARLKNYTDDHGDFTFHKLTLSLVYGSEMSC